MTHPTTQKKPKFGEPCNGCGCCCTAQPCQLAQDFLNCTTGPCIALETRGGQSNCGLVRNPLAYLYKAAHPNEKVPLWDEAPNLAAGHQLSNGLAKALGIGKGCDADDGIEAEAWPGVTSAHESE